MIDVRLRVKATQRFSVLEAEPSAPDAQVPKESVAKAAAVPGMDPLLVPDLEGGGFVGSRLGTKEYWDSAYDCEINAFATTSGEDYGEVWFGEDTLERSIDFVGEMVDEFGTGECASVLPGERASCPVLDVGCGNATTMIALAKEGFKNLTGSDYSSSSISLSARVLAHAGYESYVESLATGAEGTPTKRRCGFRLVVDDVLSSHLPPRSFGLAVDKGTLDAIGLHPTTGARDRQLYLASLSALLRPGGLLVITSCNSTTEELTEEVTRFSYPPSGGRPFAVLDHVRYSTFQFGGVEGQRVSTVAFRRRQASEIAGDERSPRH